ncbi:hypothetical protein WDU94_011944 [Cyamophila willieti]
MKPEDFVALICVISLCYEISSAAPSGNLFKASTRMRRSPLDLDMGPLKLQISNPLSPSNILSGAQSLTHAGLEASKKLAGQMTGTGGVRGSESGGGFSIGVNGGAPGSSFQYESRNSGSSGDSIQGSLSGVSSGGGVGGSIQGGFSGGSGLRAGGDVETSSSIGNEGGGSVAVQFSSNGGGSGSSGGSWSLGDSGKVTSGGSIQGGVLKLSGEGMVHGDGGDSISLQGGNGAGFGFGGGSSSGSGGSSGYSVSVGSSGGSNGVGAGGLKLSGTGGGGSFGMATNGNNGMQIGLDNGQSYFWRRSIRRECFCNVNERRKSKWTSP